MRQKLKEKILLYKVRTKQDPEAFASLYDLYVEKIYRFVYFKISNKEDAEDITSDIFLKAWKYLSDTQKKIEIKSFSGFLYQIARNRIVDVYRNRAKQFETPLNINIHANIESQVSEIKKIEQNYDAKKILLLVQKLKQEYQEVITLHYIEEMQTSEIADILGKSQTAVRVTLHRAMKKLKQLSEG